MVKCHKSKRGNQRLSRSTELRDTAEPQRCGSSTASSPPITWNQEKGTVQRVERRSTTLHHFLKGSDGLSRLLCGSPACSGIMRPCCRRPSTVLQAYVCALLLLLLSVKADGEFWICYLFFSSGLVFAPRCLTQSNITRLRERKQKTLYGICEPPSKKDIPNWSEACQGDGVQVERSSLEPNKLRHTVILLNLLRFISV